MDFARKQLEKYGWTTGKGLGKHENGISEALKPKLKRSVTGVGHDPASEFTEHWWSTLYNKAAGNIEIKEKNGKTKKIKTKDSTDFEITSNSWHLKRKRKDVDCEQPYSNYFVKTAILNNDTSNNEVILRTNNKPELKEEVILKISDEELFAACEGRTAHKGARHGLKALGKLARIEQQEQILLKQAKYNGYSQTSKTLIGEKGTKTKQKGNDLMMSEILNDGNNIENSILKKKKKHSSKEYSIINNEKCDTNPEIDIPLENNILQRKRKKKKCHKDEKYSEVNYDKLNSTMKKEREENFTTDKGNNNEGAGKLDHTVKTSAKKKKKLKA